MDRGFRPPVTCCIYDSLRSIALLGHEPIDGNPLRGIVAGAHQLPVLAAPAVRHIVVAEEAGSIWRVQPQLHLACGIGGISHTGLEVVEEVAQQEKTVVGLALDDLSGSPQLVMDVGQNQPAHRGRGHWVTAMHPRSLLSACWPWCQRRTHSRQTP